MYTQFLELRTVKNRLSVFCKVPIPAKVPILEISGEIYSEATIPDINHPALLQIGTDSYLGPSGGADDYLNHSCDPNCKVVIAGNRAILYSMYVIPINNELTFDYSTTSTDTLDQWQYKCTCESSKCRQLISGHHYLSESIKKDYTEKRMLPLYILYPNMFQKL